MAPKAILASGQRVCFVFEHGNDGDKWFGRRSRGMGVFLLHSSASRLTWCAGKRQLRTVRELHGNIVPLELELHRIKKLSQDCEEANIEENDHTVHSYDDLEYEYGLAKESVTKKLGFLENQVFPFHP